MFDVDRYLERIGCAGESGADLATLRTLQRNHLMTIPYNSTAYGSADSARIVDLDDHAVFQTSIAEGRGGACYHLNRLFHLLLRQLGYDVTLVAGSTAEGRDNFDTDIEHMFNLVALEGQQWLVDVGYPGPSYVEPLRLSAEVQIQYGSQFRLVETGSRLMLQRRGPATRWSGIYTFTTRPRRFADWLRLENTLKTILGDPRRADSREVLCGRAIENGHVFLRQRRYLTVHNGREQVRTITDDDEHRTLRSAILREEA